MILQIFIYFILKFAFHPCEKRNEEASENSIATARRWYRGKASINLNNLIRRRAQKFHNRNQSHQCSLHQKPRYQASEFNLFILRMLSFAIWLFIEERSFSSVFVRKKKSNPRLKFLPSLGFLRNVPINPSSNENIKKRKKSLAISPFKPR